MTPYNKEEVMKVGEYAKGWGIVDILGSTSSKGMEFMAGRCTEEELLVYRRILAEEIQQRIDAAYKAGREEMYLAGGKVCKKAYQNHKEDHLCRFNDGEQNCNCYLSGINEVIVALEALK